jgi:2-methylisocitrate lyase-like PEP mutase family enzyme
MTKSEKMRKKLRELLVRPGMLLLPKVGDALGARIVEEAGFEVVGPSGHCVGASYGMPDAGLLTMTEMVVRATFIAEAVDLPVIADIDTGYGNAINVIRTIREFERAGVAAVHIEDQVSPKRCGQLTGKSLISIEEMVGKIRAAVDTRTDQDFGIIARTDAMDTDGIAETIKRGLAYEEAGADVIYVITHRGPHQIEQVKTLASAFTKPLCIDISEAGPQPIASFADLATTGVKIVSIPLTLSLFTATTAMRRAAREIKEFGLEGLRTVMVRNDSWESIQKLLSLNSVIDAAARYSDQAMVKEEIR